MRVFTHCFLVALLLVSVCNAQDLLPWTVSTVFPLSGIPDEQGGPCARIATMPATGSPVVAFLANGTEPGDTFIILYNYPFGTYEGWDFLRWDTGASVSDLDMDFWSSPTIWKFGLTFRNRLDQSLHLIELVLEPSSGLLLSSLDHEIQDAESFSYGVGTSIRYDSSGTPHIACYVSTSLAADSLMYATPVASGGNCGIGFSDVGKWSCQTIDAGTSVGRDPSLTLDGSEQPVIAYTKLYGAEELDIVFVARPTSPGTGNCWNANWDCQYPDYMIGFNNQSKASAHFDQSPAATGLHVAFLYESAYDPSPTAIRHARYVGDGSGDCGITSDWVCDSVQLAAEGDALELSTNASGNPVLAYHTSDLDEVVFVEYLGVSWAGNCGFFDTWLCGTLEPDIGTATMGEWLDVTLDSWGSPQVVYSKISSPGYLYELKLAVPWTFRDGFESGNLFAWSSVVD